MASLVLNSWPVSPYSAKVRAYLRWKGADFEDRPPSVFALQRRIQKAVGRAIMPTIEQLFDITTGLALAELRDTRQPLLRELQSRAPGTYNHSLAVASIAENAAEAIGADSRLVYVGGLYHDVGKLNKPEYFIENQGGGDNKHDKLSPAMSLLVIIGHVKDGLELAQEYGLPRVLQIGRAHV